MNGDALYAAVAAGVLASEEQFRLLLQSIADVARAIFGAKAASIFLLDEESDELVFAAVAGEGSSSLVGTHLPSGTGIAGWVLQSRTPLVLDDVQNDPRFARDVAETTGYVPNALMAVPLLHEERTLGVLQVLDRPQRSGFSLHEMELLGLFGNQAAIALDLLVSARKARAVLEGGPSDVTSVARVAAAVDALEGDRRAAGLRLLSELERVLR
jgi:GAF domain-containing protein